MFLRNTFPAMILSVLVLLSATRIKIAAAQNTEPDVTTPLRSVRIPLAASDKDPPISVAEAILRANETLDRLPSAERREQVRAMIESINGYLDVIRASDPGNPQLAFLYGRLLAYTGRQGDAIEQLRTFVETREGRNEWQAFRLLGDLFVGEFPQLAQANYQKARALTSTEPSILLGLSRCSLKLGDLDKAISQARLAVELDGRSDARYLSHLARALNQAGKRDEALREAQAALESAERSASDAPGRLAPLLRVDAQYQLLIDVLRARIQEATAEAQRDSTGFDRARFADDHQRLATCLRNRAKHARRVAEIEVVRLLESGVNITSPTTPPGLLEQYGATLVEVGRLDAAVEVFRQLLDADPGNATAKTWLQQLGHGPMTPPRHSTPD